MSRSLHFHSGGPDFTGRDFVADLGGFLYVDGNRADASDVVVVVDAGSPDRFFLDALPDETDRVYAVSFIVAAGVVVAYWPDDGHFAWRLLPFRAPDQTLSTLGVRLFKDTDDDSSTLSVVEGGAGDNDWIVEGWPEDSGDWSLMWRSPTTSETISWQVFACPGRSGGATRSLPLHGDTDLTGLDFVADLAGFLYADGARVNAGDVSVLPDGTDPTLGHFTGLPDVPSVVYVASYVLDGSPVVEYWPDRGFFDHRLVSRTPSQTVGSLELKSFVGTSESAAALVLTEGAPGDEDRLARGWPESAGNWGLSWIEPATATAESINWQVPPCPIGEGGTPSAEMIEERQDALDDIAEEGAAVVLRFEPYSIPAGQLETVPGVSCDVALHMVVQRFSKEEIDGRSIRAGDVKLLVADQALAELAPVIANVPAPSDDPGATNCTVFKARFPQAGEFPSPGCPGVEEFRVVAVVKTVAPSGWPVIHQLQARA